VGGCEGKRRWLDLSISRESNRFLYESEQINRKNQAIKSLCPSRNNKSEIKATTVQNEEQRHRARGAFGDSWEHKGWVGRGVFGGTEAMGLRKYQNGNKWCWYPAKRVKTLTMPPKLVNHKNYCMRWNKLRWRHRHRSGCTTITTTTTINRRQRHHRTTELSALLPIPRILAAATMATVRSGRQWRRLPLLLVPPLRKPCSTTSDPPPSPPMWPSPAGLCCCCWRYIRVCVYFRWNEMTDAAQDANLPMECWPGQAELANTLQGN